MPCGPHDGVPNPSVSHDYAREEMNDDACLPAAAVTLADFPNEVLLHIFGYLDVSDLLAASRVSALACCSASSCCPA